MHHLKKQKVGALASGSGIPEPREVDDILNALELVNKEAIKSGLGGGLHGPASKMLSGINMLKAKNTMGPLSFLHDVGKSRQAAKTEELQGARYMSNYKAELVRHNIVTRTDLMKLYHPPIRKAALPSKDPFLMRQIVPKTDSNADLKDD